MTRRTAIRRDPTSSCSTAGSLPRPCCGPIAGSCSFVVSAGSDGSWAPQVLDNDRLDLAVARGAAYYGMVRRGEGVRIAANLARSYYIGVEADPPSAVCLVPGDAEPGHTIDLEQPLQA